ncbi:MAG: nucleoside monophosphate kinase [Candidatus Aminicenantales bacterium]
MYHICLPMKKKSLGESQKNIKTAMDQKSRDEPSARHSPAAILLLGPTGSGKTPLGDSLEKQGLWGRRCVHFDFGSNLRRIASSFEGTAASGKQGEAFSHDEKAVIIDSLAGGVLLEDENFPIAGKILTTFIEERKLNPDDLLILNGLPRHAGQARNLDKLVDVKMVVELVSSAEVLRERMRLDAEGDRAGRPDDSPEAVEKKLRIYGERTLPLIAFYASRNVPPIKIRGLTTTRADEIRSRLERQKLRESRN